MQHSYDVGGAGHGVGLARKNIVACVAGQLVWWTRRPSFAASICSWPLSRTTTHALLLACVVAEHQALHQCCVCFSYFREVACHSHLMARLECHLSRPELTATLGAPVSVLFLDGRTASHRRHRYHHRDRCWPPLVSSFLLSFGSLSRQPPPSSSSATSAHGPSSCSPRTLSLSLSLLPRPSFSREWRVPVWRWQACGGC
jgi:hypothetical protein